MTSRHLLGLGRSLGSALRWARLAPGGDVDVLARGFASLRDSGSRQAFLHTVRAVIDVGGQRVSAHDRLQLAALIPTLIVWAQRDSIIAATHGRAAHADMPGSQLEIFPGVGHMPHDADPDRFARMLTEFRDSTEGARLTADHWQPMLASHP